MKRKTWLIPAIGAVALGFLAIPGQAAVGGVTAAGSDLRLAAGENTGVEQVHGRYRYYRDYRYYYRPYRYHRPYGYYWYRPGIYFSFGPRRHHHRRHHHW
jgi:hypothetical protein